MGYSKKKKETHWVYFLSSFSIALHLPLIIHLSFPLSPSISLSLGELLWKLCSTEAIFYCSVIMMSEVSSTNGLLVKVSNALCIFIFITITVILLNHVMETIVQILTKSLFFSTIAKLGTSQSTSMQFTALPNRWHSCFSSILRIRIRVQKIHRLQHNTLCGY